MTDKEPRYIIKTHAMPPMEGTSDEERALYESDLATARMLGKEMNETTPYRHIEFREGAEEEATQNFHNNLRNQILFLAYKDEKPVGMLAAGVSHLFDLDYVGAYCLYLFVRQEDRDGKSAALLLSAFRQWAQQRQADEMRILVTSADNIDKTHEMLTDWMGFAHLGGNFAYPLTKKGRDCLDPIRTVVDDTMYKPVEGPPSGGEGKKIEEKSEK